MTQKTVLITGATRGIGKGVAIAFADAGWIVYGTGRPSTGSGRPLSETAWAAEKKIILKEADVADQPRMAEIMQDIKDKHGRLDCLINNAGVASNTPASALGDEEIAKIIDTNFKAVFTCCQSYYKMQRKSGPSTGSGQVAAKGGGCIINISSVLGIVGTSLASVYSGTKGAVISMTKALAIEWANSGFRVNAICPGFIDTDMTDMLKKRESVMAKMLEFIPLKRLGTPEDIAAPAIMLASDGAAYITGQIIVVDGGLTAM
ncbi:SDR family NAD(P)-dependent oxidoreductase [Turneriella parva]|uniref:Short-chain dehydrogenase/reductase SDR n=1 Tax=Turneriella parva (strain ATCC BAA-1111 / DSM 21527 / NCTC 11395 / H) TaxID=869212 RepID=I4B4X9_TURPD|nr:SDR family oxidoreductase [Turneriella parva]AFM12336.1 short-chain dehydrogenase/reductase SDR [Turneriella parva DSM 21527]